MASSPGRANTSHASMDIDEGDPTQNGQTLTNPLFTPSGTAPPTNYPQNKTDSETPPQVLTQREECPNLYETDDNEPPADSDPECPNVTLSAAEKRELRCPWARSLIDTSNSDVESSKKWCLKGLLTLVDIGNEYYIAKFANADDFHHVLMQGPCMIGENYLTIRRWKPNFDPFTDEAKVLMAWIRIPELSMEYFHEGFLRRVGSLVGRVIRVDRTTIVADRG
ncbi:hypothetical protein V2J09_015543 [Rumex salicifolius]